MNKELRFELNVSHSEPSLTDENIRMIIEVSLKAGLDRYFAVIRYPTVIKLDSIVLNG